MFAAIHPKDWRDLVGDGRSVRDYASEYAHKPDLYLSLCADLSIEPVE